MVYPLWRRNIYKTQSNLEVSQSFRLLFNYLGMTQLMAGGGVALIGMQLIPLLANLFG